MIIALTSFLFSAPTFTLGRFLQKRIKLDLQLNHAALLPSDGNLGNQEQQLVTFQRINEMWNLGIVSANGSFDVYPLQIGEPGRISLITNDLCRDAGFLGELLDAL